MDSLISFLSSIFQIDESSVLQIFSGAQLTLKISFFSVFLGLLLGLIVVLFTTNKFFIIRSIGTAYVELLRGTPLLVQLFIIVYGLNLNLSFINAGILALSINSSAYIAEILRGGIQSIDKGQREAGSTIGLNKVQIFIYILLPQIFFSVLPSLVNEFVVIIKETSIVYVIGLGEIMFQAKNVGSVTYDYLYPYFFAAFTYFIITFTLTRLMKLLEWRLEYRD